MMLRWREKVMKNDGSFPFKEFPHYARDFTYNDWAFGILPYVDSEALRDEVRLRDNAQKASWNTEWVPVSDAVCDDLRVRAEASGDMHLWSWIEQYRGAPVDMMTKVSRRRQRHVLPLTYRVVTGPYDRDDVANTVLSNLRRGQRLDDVVTTQVWHSCNGEPSSESIELVTRGEREARIKAYCEEHDIAVR